MDSQPPSGGMPPAQPPPILAYQYPVAPPRPPRRSRFWIATTVVLAILFCLSLLANFQQLFASLLPMGTLTTHTAGPVLEEVLIEHAHSRNKIAVVSVQGIITGSSLDGGAFSIVDLVKAQLERAAEETAVRAIVLKVDSPGGEVLASDEIYKAIAEFQEEHHKPVVASMGSVAASGGYYVSAPCQWIVANELTITGSIGVILQAMNFRGLMDKVGVRADVYKSGRFKDMLSSTKRESDISDEERAMVQKLVDESFARFKQVIGEGRETARDKNKTLSEPGRALNEQWERFADGRVLSGKEAAELGFVDELGDFKIAVQRAKKLAGIEEARVVEFVPPFSFGSLFRLFGRAPSQHLGVELGIEFPKLKSGYLYFLSATVVR